jgi:hypothetical protein
MVLLSCSGKIYGFIILWICNSHTFFSFAKNENVLVMAISLALDENELADQLYLPLSEEAFTEFH